MKKIIFSFCFILVTSCGFKPIFSSSEINFSLNKIEYQNKLGKTIYNNLKHYLNKSEKKFNYDLFLESTERKEITLKNKKGDASSFRLTIKSKALIIEQEKLIFEKTYEETFVYKKFELSKYEEEIKQSMLNKISEEIILTLYTIQ